MHTAQRIQGCLVPAKEILWLRRWVDFHPHWSRKQLARELCLQWQWLDGRGRLKDFAARSFLLKLEGQGQIRLPALQANKRRVRRGVDALAHWEEPPVLGAGLQETQPLRLELVRGGSAEQRAWAFYWDRYHYLGLRVVGENIGYLVKDPRGRELACPPETAPVDFGGAVQAEARRRGLGRARYVCLVMDGAKSGWRSFCMICVMARKRESGSVWNNCLKAQPSAPLKSKRSWKGKQTPSKTIGTLYTTKRWPRLAHPLAVGRSSPSGLNSKTDSEVVVGSGSDQALPICCV